ncbi:hypothetical protein [Rothia nasimurium]|uniref:hypothetical protein n=1 Tax=Rothia nasimurium TaxID=85336 RepID=UPI001F3C6216|nr:hypothetical protein [Rothia nasimurium]
MTAAALALAALPDVAEPAPNRRERRSKRPTRRADTARFYSPDQLHELTGIPKGTLAQWRHKKYMFNYHRIGSHILYDREHVEQVLAQHTITANADY